MACFMVWHSSHFQQTKTKCPYCLGDTASEVRKVNLYKTQVNVIYWSFVKMLTRILQCSGVVECHLASSGGVPDLARMDCDEGAVPAIWHRHPAMCTCSAESPVGRAGDGKSCSKHSGLPTT